MNTLRKTYSIKENSSLSNSLKCYRFAFQGQQSENELYGEGNASFFKYRISDNRLGRFFAIDPLAAKYPHNSPYAFSENKVIYCVELEGLEAAPLPNNSGLVNTRFDFNLLQREAGIPQQPKQMDIRIMTGIQVFNHLMEAYEYEIASNIQGTNNQFSINKYFRNVNGQDRNYGVIQTQTGEPINFQFNFNFSNDELIRISQIQFSNNSTSYSIRFNGRLGGFSTATAINTNTGLQRYNGSRLFSYVGSKINKALQINDRLHFWGGTKGIFRPFGTPQNSPNRRLQWGQQFNNVFD